MNWIRYRFQANEADPRPVVFPPPGPFWITGYGDDYAVVVAYLPAKEVLSDFWPDAHRITSDYADEITFSDRFPEPDWWTIKQNTEAGLQYLAQQEWREAFIKRAGFTYGFTYGWDNLESWARRMAEQAYKERSN